MTKEEYSYWLANINHVGVKKIELLLQVFGCAEEVYRASEEELGTFMKECCPQEVRFTAKDISELCKSRVSEKIHDSYAKLIQSGIYFVSKEDERYPDKLRNIYGAPYALYMKGNLPGKEEKLLAIVGARECSPYGREMAKYFAGAIAKEGIAVVSGLARGIDSYAHEGALAVQGITYGVLGCGINICYPKENINLFMEMQKNGGIISEYAPGVQPFAGNFPMRNRIISGLCDGILVIEAKEKSGSLITVDIGLEQGKDIYALPGKVSDQLSCGCNNLIKMGAKLVTTPEDILEDFILEYKKSVPNFKKNNKLLELNEKIVYASLCLDPKHIEEIAVQTGLSMDLLMEKLLILELRGLVKQTMKNYYIAQD
ncbi:MAG TPA: DNA-processing protein DprA [Mobilitalea sp.]|nr:DNA-processing protein DprA [Mobilitalea sp.]